MSSVAIPFDSGSLDLLMLESGIDCILATSRHNVRYLLGGHYPHLFATGPTMGLGGYLSVVGYFREHNDLAFLVGNPLVGDTREAEATAMPELWISEMVTDLWSSKDAAAAAAALLERRRGSALVIGLEMSSLPAVAYQELALALTNATFVDATAVLEELRAVKTDEEISTLRQANIRTTQAIIATAHAKAGVSKRHLLQRLRVEDATRDLSFHHGLIAVGPSLVRTPSDETWTSGASASIDHGAELNGYHGDVARMAILGQPSQELIALWREVSSVQSAAIATLRPGATGRVIFEAASAATTSCPHSEDMFFTAHGIGLNQHEAPRLTVDGFDAGPRSYVDRGVQAGMTVSIETQMKSRVFGLLKIEDSVVITTQGSRLLAEGGLDWISVD